MEDNPYREPAFVSQTANGLDPGFGLGADGPSDDEIRAFVGRKAGYYLRHWAPALDHSLGVTGFNMAGFFLTGLWLAYRKMYRMVFILLGILAAETLLEEFAVAGGFVKEETLKPLDFFITLIFSIVCAKFGNAWYLAHTVRQIAQVRGLGLQDEAYYKALARRGRPSLLSALGFLILVVLFGAALAVASEFMFSGE
jgi:hypothetical protein